MRQVTPEEEQQRLHHQQISQGYDLHYSDTWSIRYRDSFMRAPMVTGLEKASNLLLNRFPACYVCCQWHKKG